jgi:osmoprotectant transport system ATP-binding protein
VPVLLKWPPAPGPTDPATRSPARGCAPALFRTRFPHQLSGGQQQRVGVARALAADPDILLMDEPFGALDPITRASLQAELVRIHRLSGKTIVLVTHDIDEALRLATRIVLLDHGRIVQAGAPVELLARPANDLVADFVGRADVGLKLLGLRTVADAMRPGEGRAAADGEPINAGVSLREALSVFVSRRVDGLRVVDDQQRPLGVLHVADLLKARP